MLRDRFSKRISEYVGKQGGCLFWAGVTASYLHSKGAQVFIAGGTASFPATDYPETVEPPTPTHGTFQWSPNDPRAGTLVDGSPALPEVHSWTCVMHEDEAWFIDLSIREIPAFFGPMFKGFGVDWTWKPPEYLQEKSDRLNGEQKYTTPLYAFYPDASRYVTLAYIKMAREFGFPRLQV